MSKRTEEPAGLIREPVSEYSTARRLSATEVARNFSDILNRVRYRGEHFVIERGGEPVGELRPLASPRFTSTDLAALLRSLPRVDASFLDDLEEITRNQPPVEDSPWEP